MNEAVTSKVYGDLQVAYDFFNEELFAGRLPQCLIVFSYHRGAHGYFRPKPFLTRDQLEAFDEWEKSMESAEADDYLSQPGIDEISLNIFHFRERSVRDIMSTLVHEMCHLEQFHFGKPPKRPSHNKEWGAMMKAVGLHPSETGEPGGKETGRKVSHYVVEGGPYDRAFERLPVSLDWVGQLRRKKKKTREPKVTYECPECEARVRGKSGLSIECKDCEATMESA